MRSFPSYCPGVAQAADLLTKALPSARILELAAIWGLLEHGISRPAEAQACSEARAMGSGTVAQQDLQLSTLAVLLALFQVVGASSQSTDEDEDLSLPVSLDADLMLAVSIICIGVCFIAVWEFLKWCFSSVHRPPRGRDSCVVPEPSQGTQVAAPSRSNRTGHPGRESQHVRRQQARSPLLQRPNAAPHRQPAPGVNRQVELQRASLQRPRGPNSTALRPVPRSQTRTGLSSTKCASSATGAPLTTRSTAQG